MWLECSACDVSMYAGVYSFPMSNIMRTRAHTEDEEGWLQASASQQD